MIQHWALPQNDRWSTPFAEVLIRQLDLFPGASVLDVASGGGVPAFYLADRVGPDGRVLAVDIHPHQVLRGNSLKGGRFPWLQFEVGDMKNLPETLPRFDRITGNLSFMFFRPDRPQALKSLVRFLKPGGQIVLTFPSRGTFDSLWNLVDREMTARKLERERLALHEYLEERPSAEHARTWLQECGLEQVDVNEVPLEVKTGPGREFLEHPLLRGGFLDDIYECFEDPVLAEEFMQKIAADTSRFTPLHAMRCAMSGWAPQTTGD
ncbi:MAG: methyltransferase domain-containing protein [Nitrospina sp.]|nr:methyltransferase domain-containing protein [Nitrospina sp.]